MKYLSTRDRSVHMESAQAIEMGLSRDGGLLTPERIPQIDQTFLESLVSVRYQERAARVMGLYLTDYTEAELLTFAENAYGPEKFDTEAVAPVRTLDDATHCLELWHGPTSAFKDMALQMLPQLLSAALKKTRIFVCGTSAKPSIAALPVSPEVATRMQAVLSSPVFFRAAESSCGSICSAMSLKALVGPCQSSRQWVASSRVRTGATASVSNFSGP